MTNQLRIPSLTPRQLIRQVAILPLPRLQRSTGSNPEKSRSGAPYQVRDKRHSSRIVIALLRARPLLAGAAKATADELRAVWAHSGRFDARNSSTRMRSRALVVRSISSCRRGGKDVIAWCAASLPTRSSTHVCAHPSTIRTTPISIHHGLYCSSISLHKPSRSAPSSVSSTVQLPTWCSSAILVHRQAAHHFSSLPSCVWTNTDARLAQCELVARVSSTFGYGSLEPFQSDKNICSNCCLPRHLFHKIGASALAHH